MAATMTELPYWDGHSTIVSSKPRFEVRDETRRLRAVRRSWDAALRVYMRLGLQSVDGAYIMESEEITTEPDDTSPEVPVTDLPDDVPNGDIGATEPEEPQ